MQDVATKCPKFIVKPPGGAVKEIAITKSEFTIGRKDGNDLVVEDPAVSGRHARLVKIHAVYFLEDLGSTNGTFVNGQKIERRQLRDTDVVAIGKHRLIFREENAAPAAEGASAVSASDRTMVITGSTLPSRGLSAQKAGMIQVVSGRTNRKEYQLTKQLTIIGSSPDATIKLAGWFTPKTAAMIGRRGQSYYLAAADDGKKVLVNNQAVKGQVDLKDGDLVEVAGARMYFYLRDTPAR